MKRLIPALIYFIMAFNLLALNPLEEKMIGAGMADVLDASPSLLIDLMYARPDNFTSTLLYPADTSHAYLHPLAAKSLAKAQDILARERPGYRLLIKDAARPVSVQRRMFDSVKGTPKAGYVANPARGGGVHNFGMAVDITIADPEGRELPMGTPVDHLGVEANIDREAELVKRGVITEQERQNRLLLRRVMTAAGFRTLRTEWWHFERVRRATCRTSYRLLDF